MIECIATDRVYRNPKPHLYAIHARHPSLTALGGGAMVATFDLGQGAESFDYRTWIAHSSDEGATWSAPRPLFNDDAPGLHTHTIRTSALRDGSLIGIGVRHLRKPDEGIVNRRNFGWVPTELFTIRSSDRGQSWSKAALIQPPLVGPFEICHAVRELSDGRLLWPTATVRDWDGNARSGMKAVAFVSNDGGQTWPDHIVVFDGSAEGVHHMEQSVVELPDHRLLAVSWVFDERKGVSDMNRYAIANDGCNFSAGCSTEIKGETAKLLVLDDRHVVCVYRRCDKPGLWANVVRIEGDRWLNVAEAPIWSGAETRMFGQSSVADELSELKFGYPSLARLEGGDVMVAFWCLEDEVYNIRWARLRIHV